MERCEVGRPAQTDVLRAGRSFVPYINLPRDTQGHQRAGSNLDQIFLQQGPPDQPSRPGDRSNQLLVRQGYREPKKN